MSSSDLPVRPAANTSHYQPLVPLVGALAAGISLDASLPLGSPVWLALSLLMLGTWWWTWRRERLRISHVLLLAAIAAGGGAWHHDRWCLFAREDLGRWATESPRPAIVEVVALTSARWQPPPPPHPLAGFPRRDETEMLVRMVAARREGRWVPASGEARLSVPGRLESVYAGDRLRVAALCSRPRRPLNPGEFDGQAAERGQRRLCQLQAKTPEAIAVVARGSTWSWRRQMDDMRRAGEKRLQAAVGPRHAALATAIMLGSREQLETDVQQSFFRTGLAHLLAISGLNVAIFAYGFWAVARLGCFPRRGALLIAGLLAVFYALLTDAQPPVVRAAILVVCVCTARFVGRPGLALNTLAAAGILVLLVNPIYLFQTGAQLSFLAVAVLCHRSPAEDAPTEVDPLDALIARTRPWWQRVANWSVRQMVAAFVTSARVWLISLPLVVVRFHLLSPIALVLNPLVMLPTAVALYGGFGALVCGGAFAPIGRVSGRICAGALEALLVSMAWGQTVPGNHVWTPAPPAWWMGAYFVGLVSVTLEIPWRWTGRWAWAMFVVWMAFGAWLSTSDGRLGGSRPDAVVATFVAVGHGAAVLVELPDGRNLLYDCGRLGWPPTGARLVSGVLWSRGVRHLDAVILSHADTDHYNGLPDLLERFSVGIVYVSPAMFREPSAPLDALRAALEQFRVPVRVVAAGHAAMAGPTTRLEVLHPLPTPSRGGDNAQSIVLLVEHAGRRMLLTGDLESPGLEELLSEEPIACDVLMAPHHGSRRSDPDGFAQWARPKHVVVSGSGAREGTTALAAYERRGARVWQTSRHGAIEIRLEPTGATVRPFRVDLQAAP